MTTLIIAALGIATLIFVAAIISIALAHRRGRPDYDGMEFEEPPNMEE